MPKVKIQIKEFIKVPEEKLKTQIPSKHLVAPAPKDMNGLKTDRKQRLRKDQQEDDVQPSEAAREQDGQEDTQEMTARWKELTDNFGTSIEDKFLKHDERAIFPGTQINDIAAVLTTRNLKVAAATERYLELLHSEVDRLIKLGELPEDKSSIKILVNGKAINLSDGASIAREALLLPRGKPLQVKASRAFDKIITEIQELAEEGELESIIEILLKDKYDTTHVYLQDGYRDDKDQFLDEDTEKQKDRRDTFQRGNPYDETPTRVENQYTLDPEKWVMQDAARGAF